MAHPGGPRLVQVAPELRQRVTELVERHGVAEASRRTGLGKIAVMGVMGRGSTTAGNVLLLERHLSGGAQPTSPTPNMLARHRRVF